MSKILFLELPNNGDERGYSFTAPAEALEFVGRAADVHVASIKPGAVRGNHFHLTRLAAIVVLPGSKWSFHWDEGANSEIQRRLFKGKVATLILIDVESSHAIRNDGDETLWMISISSAAYDPAGSITRKVI